MRAPVLKLAGFVLCACFAAAWAVACDDDGNTTKCEEMPVADPSSDVPSRDPDVERWWRAAVEEHCATAPLGGFAGAAGAAN